jgi:hypothetical protein
MEIACTNCGGAVPIREDDAFASCPFCGAALALEPGGAVPCLYMPAHVPESELALHLGRALAQVDVAGTPVVVSAALEHFPFWRLAHGVGRVRLHAAKDPPVEDLAEIPPLGGEALVLTPEISARLRIEAPEIRLHRPLEGAALVHVPFYRVAYRLAGSSCDAFVEAIDGGAYADAWPSSRRTAKTTFFAAFAAIGFTAFTAEALALPVGATLLAFGATAALLYAVAKLWLRRFGG